MHYYRDKNLCQNVAQCQLGNSNSKLSYISNIQKRTGDKLFGSN